MGPEVVEKSCTKQLVKLIERDISERALRTGERYLTTKQVAQFFKTSPMTADRAMRSLAKRNILVRRRKAGTFVGEHSLPGQDRYDTKCVHLVVPHDFLHMDGHTEDLFRGIRKELPDVNFQLNFLATEKPLDFLKRIVDRAENSDVLGGIVLVSNPREICQFFRDRDLPVIVNGHVEANVGLPWVDRDQAQIGKMLTTYMLEQGKERIGLLMRDQWFPGDNILANAVTRGMAAAGLNAGSLTVTSLPTETQLIREAVEDMLAREDPPTALICRTETLAHEAAEAAEGMGLSVPKDVLIASCNYVQGSFSKHRIPHASLEKNRQGQLIGRLLAQLADGEKLDPDHYEISVKLEGV